MWKRWVQYRCDHCGDVALVREYVEGEGLDRAVHQHYRLGEDNRRAHEAQLRARCDVCERRGFTRLP